MLSFTDSAVRKFKEFIEEQKLTDHGIRIFAVPGGWRPSLTMDIVKGAEAGDAVLDKDGLKIFLQKETDKLFPNATIDFSDDHGFMITGMEQCSC